MIIMHYYNRNAIAPRAEAAASAPGSGRTDMRYEKGHKDETRRRIIEVAARQFREQGFAAAGVAGVMAEAGLTNGAFYAHFESKEDLLRAVLDEAFGGRERSLRSKLETGMGLEAAIRDYLSPP